MNVNSLHILIELFHRSRSNDDRCNAVTSHHPTKSRSCNASIQFFGNGSQLIKHAPCLLYRLSWPACLWPSCFLCPGHPMWNTEHANCLLIRKRNINYNREPSSSFSLPRSNLPESQPPASGDHGKITMPSFRQTSTVSYLIFRHNYEYCCWSVTNSSKFSFSAISFAFCIIQLVKLEQPIYCTFPCLTSSFNARIVSGNGVASSGAWIWYKSI